MRVYLIFVCSLIIFILKSVLYLVDNQWAASGLKFSRKYVAEGLLLEEIHAKIYCESNVTAFPSYNKCVIIWPLSDGEGMWLQFGAYGIDLVHGLCTFSTNVLYNYYKGLVQTVQRLCTKSTRALYGLVLVADELL